MELERVISFPQVFCDVPSVVLYCFPCGLKPGPNGTSLDFRSFNFVMARGLVDGGVDIKCNCNSDLSHIVAGVAVQRCFPSAPDGTSDGEWPLVSDLCKHARGLLELCRIQLEKGELWFEDPDVCRQVMLHAAQDVEFDSRDFVWADNDDSPDEPTLRELPYSGDTQVFEFLLSESARGRRHRTSARFHPGSIVTRAPSGSYSCRTCRVHSTQTRHGCECVPTVRKFLHEQDVLVREFTRGINVHKNGKSLALCGLSSTPILPFSHPNVRFETMRKKEAADCDWSEFASNRFTYAPSCTPPSPPARPAPASPHPHLCCLVPGHWIPHTEPRSEERLPQ